MQCGSDLNCYLDQNFAFKLIKAKNFEQRFKTHVENFVRRRSELQNTLAVYIAGGVDQANATVSAVSTKLDSVGSKLDYFFHAFLRKLDTPQEKEVFQFFEQNNGVETCISEDELFGRLLAMTGDVLPDSEMKTSLTPNQRVQMSREVLTDENFEETLTLNALRFERLLTVQNNNHERVIAQLEKQEGYHKVTMSQLHKLLYYMHPDTTLDDPEVRRIWERMGLKTSVKAKTFVLTFRDHYQHDNLTPMMHNPITTTSPPPLLNDPKHGLSLSVSNQANSASPPDDPNAWLLEYIDVVHVGPIIEAMDADGSGFISIKEINTFARARPKEWSLLQWMAYWAAGWHINIGQYRNKIYDILGQMHELLPSLHPANRVFVDKYLNGATMDTLEGILRSTKSVTSSRQSKITALAQFYADAQESALRTNLKEISYVISSVADAMLVAGPGRVESWLYPLLYLFLERHLAVLRLGQTQVFQPNEIYTHWLGLDSVLGVFEQRKESLIAIFSQIYQNVAGRFETFAYGMFYASYKRDTEISPVKNGLIKMRTIQTTRELFLEMLNKAQEPAVLLDTAVLALGKGTPFEFEDLNVYDSAGVKTDLNTVSHPLEGYWSATCLLSNGDLASRLGLFHLVLEIAPDGSITGVGEAYKGKLQLTGATAPSVEGSSTSSLELNIVIDNKNDVYVLHGIHNIERDVVVGSWDNVDQPQETPSVLKKFTMRRTPADLHRFRHNLNSGTETNSSILAKSRWKFAIEATKFRVQIKNFSWEYVRARFTERRLWLDLVVAFWQKLLPTDRIDLFCTLTGQYAPWQSRLYHTTASYLYQRDYDLKIGINVICDYCGNPIVCNRYRCITCINDDMSNQIDLCTDTPECIANVSSRPQYNFVHTPSHTLLRSTYWLHEIHYASFFTHCRTQSENVKERFRTLEESKKIAKKTAKVSKSSRSEYSPQMKEATIVQALFCVCCEKEVSLPCWICAICVPDTAVCLKCELKQAKVVRYDNRDTMHSHGHLLLRINDSAEVRSREADNVMLQRELINITTDLKSLEQKFTTHLRAARNMSTVLRKFTSDSKVTRVSADHNINAMRPLINEDAGVTTTVVAQEIANEEEDDNISDILGSIYSDDTESNVAPNSPPSANPWPLDVDNGEREASGETDAIAVSLSETEVYPILEAESVNQGVPVAVLPILAEALAPVSESGQIANHLVSIDSRISSLETQINKSISSLGAETNMRISGLDNRLSGLESQLGEILSLLKQSHL